MAKVKVPASPAGLEEDLNDPEKFKQLWENGPDGLKAYIDKYAREFAKADKGDVDEQIREQAQLAVAEFLNNDRKSAASTGGGIDLANLPPAVSREAANVAAANRAFRPQPSPFSSAGRALYRTEGVSAALDGIFGSTGEFFQAIFGPERVRANLAPKLSKLAEIQNSFGSEVPDAGGFLIPETLRSELLALAIESAVVRPRATVIPMSSLRVPIPVIDDTSHVSNIYGGVQWYWTEEASSLTESQASFGRVVLDAKKLTAYANVPNELLQDAPAFSGFFDSRFPQAIAYGEDVGFFAGTGAGEPQGFLNAPSMVTVAKQTGQATNTILWENVVGMYARMLPTSLRSAVWIAAPDTFPELATMALSVGTGGGPVWLGGAYGNSSGADTPPMTILGRPVIFSEKAQPLSTAGDLTFVDLSYYLVGDRMQMQTMSSEHFRFANDQTSFRVIERVDGRPWLQSALTPHNNSANTLSAFIQIASR